MKNVVDLSARNQQIIQINSIKMYIAIDEYRRSVMAEKAEVNTKYKTVDKKIRPILIPLPKDSWQRMKEVA